MKRLLSVLALAAVAGCAEEAPVTAPSQTPDLRSPTLTYRISRLDGSLGGTATRGMSINLFGQVAGFSQLPNNVARHAVRWSIGNLTDLGTLGGPSSSVQWPGQNDLGMIVGIAETAADDSLHESWSCEAFLETSGKVCRGFVYEHGRMHGLPTFGGTHGFATGVNNRGQVVGWAETRVHDPTCREQQVLQFRAAIWDARRGTMTQLRPYRGDSTSAATAINERGQAVGISGECDVAVGRYSARHAVLWENGRVTSIGTLGGQAWHTPMAMNELGDVVGFSNPPSPQDQAGDLFPHGFLWTRHGGIRDLGVLAGDSTSQALGINSWGQVVGTSTGGPNGGRAFLYQNGVMRNLNDLVEAGFTNRLLSAQSINELGQITGRMLDLSTNLSVPYIATPVWR